MLSKALTPRTFLVISAVLAASCAAKRPLPKTPAAQNSSPAITEADLAHTLSAALATNCPEVSPSDVEARQHCADRLMHLPALQGHMQPSLLWGAQSIAGDYDLGNSQTTRFDPLVFRRMYLSTFMFSSQYRLEQLGDRSILHVPVHFRYALDPGEYPYPFWHSEKKWRSYQQTQELLIFLEAGQVVAVLRGAALDPARTVANHPCDGCLQWKGDGSSPSRVALYRFMFSRENPHVAAVDDAFRAFEQAQRRVDCMSCHNPGNPSKMNPLELFSYPNQALSSRHTIVRTLEYNHMPPATKDAPAGIADESYRHDLLELARRFAAAGDRALEFETHTVSMRRE
jgi:hypothetical protein